MPKTFQQKHIIGVVERGVISVPEQRSPELVGKLVAIGHESTDAILAELNTSLAGLSAHEATLRLKKYGKNEIAHTKPPAWYVELFKAFLNPFVGILLIIGVASYLTTVVFAAPGDKNWTEVIIILVMILMSSGLRFWQEFRSQNAAEKLRALVQNKALVQRSSWNDSSKPDKREIPISELVPGDIVYLSSGDMVPADMRLLSSNDLFVSQSALTGEAMPVEKYAQIAEVSDTNEIKEDPNNPLEFGVLCFMGTNVVTGSATGVILSTSDQTYFGSMAQSLTSERSLTSFDKGINKVSFLLIRFMLVMVPIVFIVNGLTKGWSGALLFALAVAVGLTPEMLPLIVTANLAKGALKMSKEKVIIKKLNAIQNFGAMDILCTDKTGTLTENRIVLVRHLDVYGKENVHVLNLAYLNSYFQTGLKNLMDAAVIERKEELKSVEEKDTYKKIDEIPFDFARRRMSVIVQDKDGQDFLICKGAVEEILAISTNVEEDGSVVAISEKSHQSLRDLTHKLNEDGLRVIAVAYKKIDQQKHFYKVEDESDLTLVGYIGFLDPPKASAREAIALLKEHGVAVKIITGDNEIVTKKICHEVNLPADKVMLGSDIDGLSDEELAKEAEDTVIFAKIDPLQKARIVEALKSNGHTVGYMGDGINDAAAMRESDVGISVDTAVDIAKEAADIILLQNDLLVLEKGVVEGRIVFGNIMKYIKMTASSNFGNVFSVMVASVFLPFLPMLPIQILIQNLLYDFSQLSIPWDRMDEEFIKTPRKWEATGIARFMVYIGPISSIFDITTFLILWFIFKANTPAVQGFFQSGWFIEGLLSQTLIVHMIRTQKIPFIQSTASRSVVILTITIMTAGIILPFTALGHSVGLQALPIKYFWILAATLLAYCALIQLVKDWYIRKFGVWL